MGQPENGLSHYLLSLSSGEPVPGGGAVAAVEAAMGSALLVMVANLTLGRKRFAGVQVPAAEILHEAECLRDRALALASEDEEAYRDVSTALALPRGTEEEKAARRERVQATLKAAAQPPLEVMKTANSVVSLADRLIGIGNPSAVSDVGVAVLSARAAHAAARLNVEINVSLVRDAGWVAATQEELRKATLDGATVDRTFARVEAAIRGEGV